MAAEPLVIDKRKALRPSQDYAGLRASGLEYIQQLSGRIWTDHNAHDPGITILDVLCYALTDLGYRTDFSVRDLLAAPGGAVDPPHVSGLFPAHEILTTAPLTILDYRRLLLKIDGVRNAWLDPMMDPARAGHYKESEIPIYADRVTGGLSYAPSDAEGRANARVRLGGLYRVLLELEIDDRLGSLNERRLVYQARRGPLKGLVFSLDSQDPALAAGTIDFGRNLDRIVQVVSVTQADRQYTARVRVTLAGGAEVVLDRLALLVVDDRPRPDLDPVAVTVPQLTALLADGAADGPIPLFWAKQQARQRSLEKVRCVLSANRNLCEDFLGIATVPPEHVAVCADVEVKPDADLEAVQARIFHAIEQYFNPPVRHHTLKELLDQERTADEIFDGPYADPAFTCRGNPVFTKPGFVAREDLEASELKRILYVSDIVNIVMELEDVVSIKGVQLRVYDGLGVPRGPGEKWALPVTAQHQPVLSIERSKILLFKSEIPYRARPDEFRRTLDHLRAMARKAAYVEPNQVLPVEPGRHRDLLRHYSIQHDFPQTYGIGEAGLPTTASDARVAQAHQLKAYLTFYDQVLADYLAQLANVRRLFSLDETLKQTYFAQFVRDVAGVRARFEDEIYVDKAVLQAVLQRAGLIEDEALFQDRRNRLLDHLIARFAEQFTDYVLMMFALEGDPLKTGEALIDDKIDFLREYPVVSRERQKAFNDRPEAPAQIWQTKNVSGLQKRVSRLAGIDDDSRRDLACARVFDVLFTVVPVGNQFRLEIRGATGTPIFQSAELFATAAAAQARARQLHPFMRQEASYQVDITGGTGQVRYRITAGGATLQHAGTFPAELDAVQSMRAVIDRYDEILLSDAACNQEGFHLIEHILLRPTTPADPLLDVCLPPQGESCGDEDPYSFRIHVVLPYWPVRFRSLAFRTFFERLVRQETPAHVHARICWVSNEQMAELDRAHRAWLEARAATPVDRTALTGALRPLVEVLQRLKTVYPAAVLHDCLEGENEIPVRLGSTNLGIF
jgi:hypothetical protein